jgi:hypothetical protein
VAVEDVEAVWVDEPLTVVVALSVGDGVRDPVGVIEGGVVVPESEAVLLGV